MMDKDEILARLPYKKPFLFVDDIIEIGDNHVVTEYTFDGELDFYKGHFEDFPVTPGVILTETMAQGGVVCLGIFLLNGAEVSRMALTSSEIEFYKPVFPGEKVVVTSEKIYFRFGKLKCRVKMENMDGDEVCNGTIAGMIIE